MPEEISAEERRLREQDVRHAIASNAMEGVHADPQTLADVEAWARGEIAEAELMRRAGGLGRTGSASAGRPWEIGDERERWNGYLDERYPDRQAGQPVMRNLVGATTYGQLREAEGRCITRRLVTLRSSRLPRTYDLEGLRAVHRHLLQDVYEWAGDVRTVNMGKGVMFASPEEVEWRLRDVADFIREHGAFIGASRQMAAQRLASVYMMVNNAHPFREGNGRAQRAFVRGLAAESDHRVEWAGEMAQANIIASRLARDPVRRDPEPMYRLFDQITVLDGSPDAERRQNGAGDHFRDRWEELTPDQQRFLAGAARVWSADVDVDLDALAASAEPEVDVRVGEQPTGSGLVTVTGGRVRFDNPDLPGFIRFREGVAALR